MNKDRTPKTSMVSPSLPSHLEPSAWCVRVNPSTQLEGVSVSVAEDGSKCEGIKEGDAIVFVTEVEGTSSVSGFARVLRVLIGTERTTFFLDRLRKICPALPAADLGIFDKKLPQWAFRIGWSIFESALKSAANIAFNALPTFEGKSIQEQRHLRELLQLAVIEDLLGPAGGAEEEIIGMSVRDRYLVGRLSPRTPDEIDESIEGLRGPTVEPEGSPQDLQPLEEVGEGKDKASRRRLPGEEFASTSGAHEPDETEGQAVDATKNQSFVPSSLGITFCVAGDVISLDLDARWGRYDRRTDLDLVEEYERKNKITGEMEKATKRHAAWKRTPSGGKVTLRMQDGLIKPIVPDPECPNVLIQGTVRPPLASGDRLVTVFLINNQIQPEQNQDEAWVFQPELIARHPQGEAIFHRRPVMQNDGRDDERDSLEMIYRQRVEFAVGHGVSVHAEPALDRPDHATEVRTCVLPEYELPVTETPGLEDADRPAMRKMIDEGFLDMQVLAQLERPDLIGALSVLIDDYAAWIKEQNKRIGADVVGYDTPAKAAMDRCSEILGRLREGIATLSKDDNALRAFRFANLAMASQRVRSMFALDTRRKKSPDLKALDIRKNRSWRPFQLAFILLSVPALTDPKHKDRTKPVEAFADLLWFPTGGGKTEAYLGVAAFTMAIRRLQGNLGGLDASRGLAVIMRYTLRLLTLQQFQRASTLMCAMEKIRRDDVKTWGSNPFTIGLWVGQKVTPNDTEASHEAIEAERTGKRPTSSTPAQLTSCPWCGVEIAPGRDIEVRRMGTDIGRTLIFCGDKFGRCEFSRAKSPDLGLPVSVVDDEIYRRPPSMLIATVDKFAMMAWRGQVRTLFGRATKECSRHGLTWPDSECTGKHAKRGSLPAVSVKEISPLRPPDLIIQDEFHLISGPLGTMVGLYETTVDELSTWTFDNKRIRPKIIASTATVRKAAEQVNNVFLRRVAIFPPHGLDVKDNFFSVQRPIEKKPGRRYLGICAPGSARPAVLIRVYTALLTAAQALFDHFGPAADPWMTTVGYFNSLRELGGMRRLAEDDVQTRSYRVRMSHVARPGLAQRNVKNVDELTSRVSNKDIPAKLDQLELGFKGTLDPKTGKYAVRWGTNETQAIDVVLATNMLSVGVDVNRLGLMAVNGQPKSTAEYIQATSRVGRTFPGLVCTVLTWSRPRDLSHYETFEHYHSTFYKHVEAQSVTPFAPRALDRGLTGTMVGWMRLSMEAYNPKLGAEALKSTSQPEVGEVKKIIADRGWLATNRPGVQVLATAMVGERCDEWTRQATRGGRRLGYEAGKARKKGEDDIAALLRKPGLQAWDLFTVPMSMREVEPGVRLVMSTDNLPEGPAWKPKPPKEKAGDAS